MTPRRLIGSQFAVLTITFFVCACQAIVGDYGDQPLIDTASESDVDSNGNGSDNESSDTDPANTDVGSDSDTGPATGRDACKAGGGYWYDADDVAAETEAEFEALVPGCHDTPDENCPENGDVLLGRLLNGTPVNEPVETSDLYASGSNITDVYSTVRCLRNLTNVDLAYNGISRLDLSNNDFIEQVSVAENNTFETLDLPTSDTVRILYLNYTRLTALDLSHAENLEILEMNGGSKVTAVDVSNKPWLSRLALGDNRVSHPIDLSASIRLEYLELMANPVGEVVLPKTGTLTYVDLENTKITEVDVSSCPSIELLDVSSNKVTALDVAALGDLRYLYAHENQLTEVNLSPNNALELVDLWGNSFLATLTLPEDPSHIEELHLNDTALSALDIGGVSALRVLYLENNNFTTSSPELDFSNKPNLEEIYCAGIMIDYDVDLRESPLLAQVNLGENRIPSIELAPELERLEALSVQSNELSKITLVGCPSLRWLDLSDNNLDYNNSDAGHRLDLTGCPDLEQVRLGGNRDYVLSFLDGTFPDTFLDGQNSALGIEDAKWDGNDDSRKPAWAYDDCVGMYIP